MLNCHEYSTLEIDDLASAFRTQHPGTFRLPPSIPLLAGSFGLIGGRQLVVAGGRNSLVDSPSDG